MCVKGFWFYFRVCFLKFKWAGNKLYKRFQSVVIKTPSKNAFLRVSKIGQKRLKWFQVPTKTKSRGLKQTPKTFSSIDSLLGSILGSKILKLLRLNEKAVRHKQIQLFPFRYLIQIYPCFGSSFCAVCLQITTKPYRFPNYYRIKATRSAREYLISWCY